MNKHNRTEISTLGEFGLIEHLTSNITLGNKELARSNIKKSNTRLLLTKTHRGKVYILFILNKILIQSNTRRNKLNNTTLNKTLNGFRIL